MWKVVIDLAATLPLTLPSVPTVTVIFSHLWLASETQPVAVVGTKPPLTLTLTFEAEPPVLISTTATEPSTFLKAAVRTPEPPEEPMRTAPGRTKRLQLAKAQSRVATS
jgi:hypothetical protein